MGLRDEVLSGGGGRKVACGTLELGFGLRVQAAFLQDSPAHLAGVRRRFLVSSTSGC